MSFTVQVSIAESTFTDASDLESTVSSTLTSVEADSSTLITEIKAAASSTSKWDDVTGVSGTTAYIVTRSPTSVPTAGPTSLPTLLGGDDDGSGVSAAGITNMMIGLIAGGVLLLLAGAGWSYNKSKEREAKRNQKTVAIASDTTAGWAQENPEPMDMPSPREHSIDLYSEHVELPVSVFGRGHTTRAAGVPSMVVEGEVQADWHNPFAEVELPNPFASDGAAKEPGLEQFFQVISGISF